MSLWSLKVFRHRNYLEFMAEVASALQKSFLSQKAIPRFDRKVAENLVLHTINQLQFPVAAVQDLLEYPKGKDITRAFEVVKFALNSGWPVDKFSKQLVVQAVSYDVKSLGYMNEIADLGVLSVFSNRLFGLYSDTLVIVKALPEI